MADQPFGYPETPRSGTPLKRKWWNKSARQNNHGYARAFHEGMNEQGYKITRLKISKPGPLEDQKMNRVVPTMLDITLMRLACATWTGSCHPPLQILWSDWSSELVGG
ncbi:uncharacterized protein [Physcomitrium patens]|uniref:Uncharacterized protein n=1 Tax=Physcomitrium patens TaxID=3218 RepID=A0A2K1JR66_PHYPA|nr:uncharacterized protein LOC112289208 [Physcomitrium patens]PNR44028.1 hypothetical protein PHYPA_016411 [Physcomitrium patens]|eukprot:XP_024390002.1 uncharacterized protein LOC112289208 [Physcomitrella patens]